MNVEKKNKIEITSDKLIILSLLSSYIILTLQYFLITTFAYSSQSLTNTIQLLSKSIVGIIYIIAIPRVLKRNGLSFFLTYSITTVFILFNLLVYPKNRVYIRNEFFYIFFVTVLSFVYSYSIDDSELLYKEMVKASNVIFFIGIVTSLFIIFNDTGYSNMSVDQKYSMSLSYNLLMPSLIFINEFFNKAKLIELIKFLITLFIIILLGARGPIMCIGIFIILRLLKTRSNMTLKKIIIFSLVNVLLFLIFINFEKFIYNIYMYSKNNFGMESRTLYKLIFTDEIGITGRDTIYKNMISITKENAMFGVGFLGDRNYFKPYPHNIFIEILTQFGVIFGGIISLIILVLIVVSIILTQDTEYRLCIIWISLGIAPLLVSNTYVEFIGFWIMLGQLIKFMKQG